MTELIKSVKALGEAITGEKIEGDTLFAAVKDAGEKMTGKELEGKELNDIIAETADAYEGGGSGGTFVVTGVNLSGGHRATINYKKLIDFLDANGINTSLTFEELYNTMGTVSIYMGGSKNPLSFDEYTEHKCFFSIYNDSGGTVKFESDTWYMLPNEYGLDSSETIKDAILSLATDVEGDSELVTLYPMPWFDIKNVE